MMKLLNWILVVLLGLLAAPRAAGTRQVDDDPTVGMDEFVVLVDQENGHTSEVAGRQGGPMGISELLLRYELVCPVNAKDTPNPPSNMPAKQTPNRVCRQWLECAPDGTKYQKKALTPSSPWYAVNRERVAWCNQWCICWLQDKPEEHFAYNQGCVNPLGKIVHGLYGSVARGTDSAQHQSNDGLAMEAFEGPPRKH